MSDLVVTKLTLMGRLGRGTRRQAWRQRVLRVTQATRLTSHLK